MKRFCRIDSLMRQPTLKAINHEMKEHIITIGFDTENKDIPKNSLIHVELSSESLFIYHRINKNYQGGTIKPVIEKYCF